METVIFSSDIRATLAEILRARQFSKLVVLTDSNTHQFCLPLVQEVVPPTTVFISVPAGEQHKTLETCSIIWGQMTEAVLDRQALVINLGGGVIGDMGGFCASVYKRGIPFITIPTTLLSQVDASVGGKLGIDFLGFKNHLGVFQLPEAVLIASEFLATLPQRELRSGYAEVIKHGLIRDATYFRALPSTNWQKQDWARIIRHSIEIKKAVVQVDPKESGLRKILNFGHTIGHAIESFYLTRSQPLLHGEAIAIGMIAEGFLSFEKIGFSFEELNEMSTMLLTIFGKVELDPNDCDRLVELCAQDKKNEGSTQLFTLLPKIGDCNYNIAVTREEIKHAILYYQQLRLA
ncbi:MAG: 3-dehydroquinate synthase [Algoriphagus sp.]|uniref:3-dehydroquinate synthase n=1 Tax=Algoriphagus sp. TaxID=1872435 RepID=UPI002779B07D|nr:3-dehydroquinate synthase [Algoriphagus sp.]MDP4748606.1 3-dehydroquinate synthase [Algoriphagus sp.]MDP4839474.1 3-dehydroquinate synthase [Algoriphagus sp.]MDP4957362.1 3-dehydroquinate synthase [Algoriphagus sp.]MDP5125842.1 3-dehydroquinate synthase [Algoriphagus sp.]